MRDVIETLQTIHEIVKTTDMDCEESHHTMSTALEDIERLVVAQLRRLGEAAD